MTLPEAAARRYNIAMSTVSIEEFQRDPLAMLRPIEAGESLLVMRGEQPLAEIWPTGSASQPRPFGLCAGQFTVPADFDRPLPEQVLKEFEGS